MLADRLAAELQKCGVECIFSVPGGYAQQLLRAFAEKWEITYCLNEQTAGYAALAYGKSKGKPAVLLVTAGCGATNCVTAVHAAWQDRTPLIVVTGQVNENYCVTPSPLGHLMGPRGNRMGSQYDPHAVFDGIAKLVVSGREDASRLYAAAVSAPAGPTVWCVPLDLQAATDVPLTLGRPFWQLETIDTSGKHNVAQLQSINSLIRQAKRPVVLLGGGARACTLLLELLEMWWAPVVVTFTATDLIPSTHTLYAGRAGIVGTRAGNLTMQSADLLVALGSRLPAAVTGYNEATWCRAARHIVQVDADEDARHARTTLFLHSTTQRVAEMCLQEKRAVALASDAPDRVEWQRKTRQWYKRFLAEPSWEEPVDSAYTALRDLWKHLEQYSSIPVHVVHASGSTFNICWHTFPARLGWRFLCSTQGDMGAEVPMLLGMHRAAPNRRLVAICGDGSFLFDPSALQTLRNNKVCGLIVVLDNDGLGSIRTSQAKAFQGRTFGCTDSYGDIGRICAAYDIFCSSDLQACLEAGGLAVWHRRVVDTDRHPRLHVEYHNGRPTALPLEDMYPLLPEEELTSMLPIPMLPRHS